jgi:hypothetical protein
MPTGRGDLSPHRNKTAKRIASINWRINLFFPILILILLKKYPPAASGDPLVKGVHGNAEIKDSP